MRANWLLIALEAFLIIFGYFAANAALAKTHQIIDALDYVRYELTRPDLLEKIKSPSNKSGLGGTDGWGITGWFEYDLQVDETGWYELEATLAGSYRNAEYILDPNLYSGGTGGAYQFTSGQGLMGNSHKVANLWLDSGRHTLRIQQYYWTGLPPVVRLELKSSPSTIAGKVRALVAGSSTTFRVNECQPLTVFSGGLTEVRRLIAVVKDVSTGRTEKRYVANLPASQNLTKQQLPIYCAKQGDYVISFTEFNGRPISARDVPHVKYEVIDTRHVRDGDQNLRKTLIQEIDCAVTEPDYTGGGSTRVEVKPFGAYRESGDVGWKKYQQLPPSLRALAPQPSWFAYRLSVTEPQRPHIVEIDYPDDRQRSFAIALRERAPGKYPVAGGVDSGGEFSLSHAMQTETLIFWPRAEDPRIVFMNARPGGRAAAAGVRVYRVDSRLPPLRVPASGGRQFANWYEEGANFAGLYGLSVGQNDSKAAIERWAEVARYMGIGVLYPTVSAYNFNFYPSSFNRAFSSPPHDDLLHRMLLVAEREGLKVIPDLHPRADELAWGVSDVEQRSNVLRSKDGMLPKQPPLHYNPIHPANQEWYLGMVGELVDRYRESPALQGVGLRVMQWANPTLNNFHSLDWGYDDYTVGRFQAETRIRIPVNVTSPERFRLRYEWLMANAKEAWIQWRCDKITALYERVSERVRKARPDLKVYSLVFDAYPSGYGEGWLREAGVDVRKLSSIEGIELINSLHAYGRLYDDISSQQTRDNLLDPVVLGAMKAPGKNGAVLPYARYFEATEVVLPPKKLGFDADTTKMWTSAVVNPAGRHYLERFAIALAETDAAFLGDGGNGFTIGQPLLQEFLREYLALPAVPFTPRVDARDPVAVWELRTTNDYYFYAVNRERVAVELSLQTEGTGGFIRMGTGEQIFATGNALQIRLAPYQLMSFKASGSLRIIAARGQVPATEYRRVAEQVEWLANLSENMAVSSLFGRIGPDSRKLQKFAEEAKRALETGNVWRARTIVEDHELLMLYRSAGSYPPRFRDAK